MSIDKIKPQNSCLFQEGRPTPQLYWEREDQLQVGIIRDGLHPPQSLEKMSTQLAMFGRKSGKLLKGMHPKEREERHTPADIGEKKCARSRRGLTNSRSTNCETQ